MAAVDESTDEGEEILNTIDDMAETRNAVVSKIREQTNTKQTMLELEDQNKRNRIEISKLQVSVLAKKDAVKKDSKSGGGSKSGEDDDQASRKPARDKADRRRRKAKKEMQALKKAIHQNVEKKEELKEVMKSQAESIQEGEAKLVSLMAQVDSKTQEASDANSMAKKFKVRLADAQHEVSSLEIQKLELEQAAVVHEGMMRERELALQKVQLQVQLRDRALNMLISSLSDHPSGINLRKVLGELAEGPVEKIFTSLMDDLPVPPSPVKGKIQVLDELEELEDEEDDTEMDLRRINGTFKDLAISLKRTSNLDAMIEQEKKAAAESSKHTGGEGKMGDDGDSDAGESKYEDYTDDDIDEDFSDDDEDYDEEFEAEPELASPIGKNKR